jgi:hypothetical protein
MNFPRIAAAAFAAWFAAMGLGYVMNEFVLSDVYLANQAAMRPEADVNARLPIGFGVLLVGYFAFAYVYAKGYEAGNGVMEGVRFGVLVAILVSCFGLFWQWVVFPITPAMAAATIVDAVFEYAVYGAIVGAIYRPLAAPAPDRAPAM